MSDPPPLLLIVDDSRTSRMLIRAMITQLRPAWRIAEAASGDDALAQIKIAAPDFVSMDVNMPGMNGLEAAGRIRISEPQIKVALCTANVQESTRQAAKKVGLYFVAKPITLPGIEKMVTFFEG